MRALWRFWKQRGISRSVEPDAVGPRLRRDVGISFHGGGAVLLDHATGAIYKTNGAGASILKGMQERLPAGQIVDALTAEYAIAGSRAAADFSAFLAVLQSRGFLARNGSRQ